MTKRKKIKYKEGDIFAVTLREGGYALGAICVACEDKWGGLGYFYGPKLEILPKTLPDDLFQPEKAVFIGQFGDPRIVEGKWPIIGKIKNFNREDWIVTEYYHYDDVSEQYFIRTYPPDYQLFDFERKASEKEAKKHIEDGVYGCGAVEIILTKLLS